MEEVRLLHRWLTEGGTRLVNGKREPEIHMAAGQVERWRIVNAASARYVRLSVGGRPFALIGTDGVERIIEIQLDENERKMFNTSVEHVKELVKVVKM